MGGFGSGRWLMGLSKATTDDHDDIDIRWMNKRGLLNPGKRGSLTWSRVGRKAGSVSYRVESNKMVLNYRSQTRYGDREDVTQTIFFDRTPCNFGGHRKWFRCPHCSRRVAVIYGAGKYFLCRHCCDLSYATRKDGAYYRLLEKADKIREKLGSDSDVISEKPKGMHWKTFRRLLDELEVVERRSKVLAGRQY